MTSLFRSFPLGDCFYSSLSVQLLAEKKFFFQQSDSKQGWRATARNGFTKKEEKYEKQTKVLFNKSKE